LLGAPFRFAAYQVEEFKAADTAATKAVEKSTLSLPQERKV